MPYCDLDFSVTCDACGKVLQAAGSFRNGVLEIDVEPCDCENEPDEDAMAEEYQRGYDAGRADERTHWIGAPND